MIKNCLYTTSQLSATEVTQQTKAENDNLFDALPEETSSTAPSVSLTQSVEQTTEIPCLSSSSDMAHAKKDCRVATIKQY